MSYIWNPEGERIARPLIDDYHPHLREFDIAHMMLAKKADEEVNTDTLAKPTGERRPRRPAKKHAKLWIAKCALVSQRYRLLFARDYRWIITVNQDVWDELSLEQQTAVMDHELCHAVVDEEGNPRIRRHDLEEFRSVVQRHGTYMADVQAFAAALKRGTNRDGAYAKQEEVNAVLV